MSKQPNPVLVEYKAILKQLETDLAIEVTIPSDSLSTFKKELSQAKFRSGVVGRLSFTETLDSNNNWVVCIVLHPKSTKQAVILSMNGKGAL